MSKALASYPEDRRTAIATRRLTNGVNTNVRGNGFWGAKDYFDKKGMRLPGKLGEEQVLAEALRRMQDGGSSFSTDAAPRDRRHTVDGSGKGSGFGKPPRGEGRTSKGRHGKRNGDRMEMPTARDGFSRVGGRPKSPSRNREHSNKPRLAGNFR